MKLPYINTLTLAFLFLLNTGFVLYQIKIPNQTNADSMLILAQKYMSIDGNIANQYADKSLLLLTDSTNISGHINYYLIKGEIAYYNDQYNESILFYDSAGGLMKNEEYPELKARYFGNLSRTYACMGLYVKALEANQQSILEKEKINDIEGIIGSENFMGAIFLEFDDFKNAEKYYNSAYKKVGQLKNPILEATLLLNIGKLKLEQDSLELADKYAAQAYQLAISKGDLRRLAASNIIKAKIYNKTSQYQQAIEKLDKAEAIFLSLDEKYGLCNIYLCKAISYFGLSNIDNSFEYAKKANKLANQIKSQPLIAKSCLQLSKLYKEKKDYKNALDLADQHYKIQGEITSKETEQKILLLEFQSQIAAKEKDIQLLSQENQLNKLHNSLLLTVIVIICFATIFLFVFLHLKNKNLKQKHELLENQKMVIEIENQVHEQNEKLLNQDLELKNKELASKALALLHLNQTLHDIAQKVNAIKQKQEQVSKNSLHQIIQDIHLATNSNIWDEFDHAFNRVHTNFYEKLVGSYPSLTSNEIKIAALLKLNLSTKEIASITFKSISAIKTVRHRLKNKLNIKEGQSLSSFLIQF